MSICVQDSAVCPSCKARSKDSEPVRGGILLPCGDVWHKTPRERHFFEMQAESMFFSTLDARTVEQLRHVPGGIRRVMDEVMAETSR